MITDETLNLLEELAEKASPAPWVCEKQHFKLIVYCKDGYLCPAGEEDKEFITAARNTIPELIAEIRRLRDEPR